MSRPGFRSLALSGGTCSVTEGALSFNLAAYSPRATGWWGSFAVHVSEHVAVVGEVSGGSAGLNTTATLSQSGQLVSFPVEIDVSGYGFAGGIRGSGRRGGPVTPFVQVLLGYGIGDLTSRLSGLNVTDTTDIGGFAVLPGAGVDITLAERVGLRLLGEMSIAQSEGVTSTSFGIQTGLVFAVGNR